MKNYYVEEVKRQNLHYFRKKALNMIRIEEEFKGQVSTVETKLLLLSLNTTKE